MGWLRHASDRRTLAIIGSWFAVEGLAWTREVGLSIATAVLLALACVGSFLGAVAAHNAVHTPVFRARRLDDAWRCVLTLTYGHPVSAFVPGHNLSHHRHLETPQDVMRTGKARWRWNLLNLLLFAPRISGSLWKAEIGYLCFAWRRRPRWRRQLLVEVLVLVAVIAALAVLDWRKLLLFVIVPHVYAGWGIITMNLIQHDGADPTSEYDHSRTFIGPAVNWLTFNNGFHAVHHLHPRLHWSQAPAAHAELVATRVDPRLIETSLVAYVFRTFVLPGGRAQYDGTPLILPRPTADLRWYP